MSYQPIPVETARQIARDFAKQIVIICAWDGTANLLHTTTYGVDALDKIAAAKGGEICAKALGTDLGKKDPNEDFRTVDAAYNAQFRDMAEGVLHCLRSYENGNVSPDLAKDYADKLESLINLKSL